MAKAQAKGGATRASRSSAVRPTDRPARQRRTTARAPITSGRVGRGKSPLNPGFPRWAVWTAISVVALLVAGWALFSSSFFGVRQVEVKGIQLVTVQQVRAAVGLGPDTSLASVDTAVIARQVEKLPPVKNATVSRSWPGTLVVEVSERTPVAAVTIDGQPWAIDSDGVAYIEASALGDKAAGLLPLEVDQPSSQGLAIREAVKVIGGLNDAIREKVATVGAKSAAQVTLRLKDGRQVIWGDSSKMNDKITMFEGVLAHKGQVYDISSPTAIVIK